MVNNLKEITFDLPGEATTIETIDAILKNNGLEESDEEFFNKHRREIEPRLIIIRDAAVALFQKKLPEEKLTELLAEHLESSKETAKKVIGDIKEKLIPYAKIIDNETGETVGEKTNSDYNKKNLQEELLKKLRANVPQEEKSIAPEPQNAQSKKIDISDVEKNAEAIKEARQNLGPQRPQPQPPAPTPNQESKAVDPYQEQIE